MTESETITEELDKTLTCVVCNLPSVVKVARYVRSPDGVTKQVSEKLLCAKCHERYQAFKLVGFDTTAHVPPLPEVTPEPLPPTPSYMQVAAELRRRGERVSINDVRHAEKLLAQSKELVIETMRAWVAGKVLNPGEVFKSVLREHDIAALNLRAAEAARNA